MVNIREQIEDVGIATKLLAGHLAPKIGRVIEMIVDAMQSKHKLLIMGNGGSAGDAQHMAAELVGSFLVKDRPALPAIALTTDTSTLTAVGNDYGFDQVFARQIEALAQEGDVVLAISTSGLSENILRGMEMAAKKGAKTIALLGRGGGEAESMADLSIVVSASHPPTVQDIHGIIEHCICKEVEKAFCDNYQEPEYVKRVGPKMRFSPRQGER